MSLRRAAISARLLRAEFITAHSQDCENEQDDEWRKMTRGLMRSNALDAMRCLRGIADSVD